MHGAAPSNRRTFLALLAAAPLGAGRADARTHVESWRKDRGGTITVGKCKLIVDVAPEPCSIGDAATRAWVRRSSEMLMNYFGRFSVPVLKVEIVTGGRGSLGWGQHFGGERITVHAGRRTSTADVERDWVMVHEMLHTAFPYLARKHRWMREGLSTYLESVVRAESGVFKADTVWRRWVRSMPNGVPDAGGPGFDRDSSWGTTYWGGGLFWLLADVRIRAQTDNKKSLKDALRLILRKGGNAGNTWSTDKAVRLGDSATGTSVLRDLYDDLAIKGGTVDLDALWKELGIVPIASDSLRYDNAPLAHVRRAMYRQLHELTPLPRG